MKYSLREISNVRCSLSIRNYMGSGLCILKRNSRSKEYVERAAKVINGLQQLTYKGRAKKSRIYQSGEKIKGEYNWSFQNNEGNVKNECRNFIYKNPPIWVLLGGTELTPKPKQIRYFTQQAVRFLTLLPEEVARTEYTSRFRKGLYKFTDNRSISG